MSSGIKVFAPASTSNLACGFDSLGIALENRVIISYLEKQIQKV